MSVTQAIAIATRTKKNDNRDRGEVDDRNPNALQNSARESRELAERGRHGALLLLRREPCVFIRTRLIIFADEMLDQP